MPGSSSTVLHALVPYSNTALARELGAAPSRAVSFEVGAGLAKNALNAARPLVAAEARFDGVALGIGCTAKLDVGVGSAFLSFHTPAVQCTLRFSKGDLVPPSPDRPESQCAGVESLLTLPFKPIKGTRAEQEQALSFNIILALHQFSYDYFAL